MSGPIYKFYRVRPSEAYYRLNSDERQALLAKIEQLSKEMGVKTLVNCGCDWNNEQWAGFGVEEFSDLEALHKYHAALNAADWFRYIESESMLGTAYGERSPGA